ncbi:N(4)-(Beta-N-acetylglucosaminyl)-L-asparaginase-like [Ruditapes philippinarum]|uniref:N(4)-(Beta-N-acetylglucosaminyl)-L-asparaginase- like n=1 Tax=Ruditapes philippinarum TaxID=129788 RepID=UPI00295AADC7|nr:N(4)-(Beta-N-acetylglucosaminyl)-L-asparaginase-like [Ruditapes philippinarum]
MSVKITINLSHDCKMADNYFRFVFVLSLFAVYLSSPLPVVVNTWPFTNATLAAWNTITSTNKTAVDAVEAGCSECESQRCDGTVGWGGDPDENGETTLDAMIMDGITHDVGSVGAIRRIKSAISVARAVMERTTHTLLVGDQATAFAKQLGFKEEDLHSDESINLYKQWKQKNCQPNYWKNVLPDPKTSCGPYKPTPFPPEIQHEKLLDCSYKGIGEDNHDTIGMIVVDSKGNVAGGTSTNGLNHKVPGRVGDSPVAGAGSYVDNDVGGAAATGDGDVMMRFLPSFHAVMMMKTGVSPCIATSEAIRSILRFYPDFVGAVVAVNKKGEHGAACHGIPKFPYSIRSTDYSEVTVLDVPCM